MGLFKKELEFAKQFYVKMDDKRADRWYIVNGEMFTKGTYFTSFDQARKCAEFLNKLFERETPRDFNDFQVKQSGRYRFWIMDKNKKICYLTKDDNAESIMWWIEDICNGNHDKIIKDGTYEPPSYIR